MSSKGDEKGWATIVLGNSAKFLEGLAMGDKCQTRFKLIPTEAMKMNIQNGKGMQAGVMDLCLAKAVIKNNKVVKSSQCTIRFDKAHRGAEFPHINIDPQGISSSGNPHIPVPESLISCAAKIDRCLKAVSKGLLIVAIVIDGIRILGAIYEDINDKEQTLPNNTIKTVTRIAGSWLGGAAGATAGAIAGAKIGACIGSFFGGLVGAVIGAPIGAVVGAMAGGISGAYLGDSLAGGLLDCYYSGVKGDFLNANDWNSTFHLAAATMVNHTQAVIDVTKGLASDKPEEKMKALTAVGGAAAGCATGATIGTAVGPVGTLVGGAIGGAVGFAFGVFSSK